MEKGITIMFEYLNLTENVMVKRDSTSSLSLCHSRIYLSVISGSICVYVSIPLLSNSWISALYLNSASSTISASEF